MAAAGAAPLRGVGGCPYEMSFEGKSHVIRDWYLARGLACGTSGVSVHNGRDPVAQRFKALNSTYTALPWMRYVTTAPRDLGALDEAQQRLFDRARQE